MLSDLDISKQCTLVGIEQIAKKINIPLNCLEQYGPYKAKVSLDILNPATQLQRQEPTKANSASITNTNTQTSPKSKLVYVTAINPTKYGEGKTVTTIGLTQGLRAINKNAIACIRQPSLGPIFGIKGGAAGGGYSQVLPMEELNLHCTGDIHAVTSAHNLAAAAIDARIYHEQKKGYADFEQRTGLTALKINPEQIVWKRSVDHNDRALRMIQVGLNQKNKTINGYQRADGFSITAASELMAIIALSTSFLDMRQRIGKIILAYSINGDIVTAEDLKVAGAMTVILKNVVKPTLMQTNEGAPVLIHSGPFANIAHGNSSIIADKVGMQVSDYVITEGGFGSDMGFEKGCNIKARQSGVTPSCAVIVATTRALMSHSTLTATTNTNDTPENEPSNTEHLISGFENLRWHIENVLKYNIPVVVAINKFATDTNESLTLLTDLIYSHFKNKPVTAAISDAFVKGGAGAIELAQKVITSCQQPTQQQFNYLYQMHWSIEEKINAVAKQGYGANSVVFSEQAKQKLKTFKQHKEFDTNHFQVCIAKNPASITDNPKIKGYPTNFNIHIDNIECCRGAGFMYALCGNVMTMPGLSEKPAFMNIDIDAQGNIQGIS